MLTRKFGNFELVVTIIQFTQFARLACLRHFKHTFERHDLVKPDTSGLKLGSRFLIG